MHDGLTAYSTYIHNQNLPSPSHFLCCNNTIMYDYKTISPSHLFTRIFAPNACKIYLKQNTELCNIIYHTTE